MRAWLSRDIASVRGLRLLVIAVTTWLLGSALFAPSLNPLLSQGMHRDAEFATMMGINLSHIATLRMDVADYQRKHGRWPENAAAVYQPDDNGLLRIDMPEPLVLRLTMSNGFPPESGLRDTRLRLHFDPATGAWTCLPDTPPLPSKWLPQECRAAGGWSHVEILLAVLIACIAALVAILLLLAFADPQLASLRRQPRLLRRLPIAQLPRLDRQLGWLRRRDSSLAAAGVAIDDWREALAYTRADADARAQLLALRVSARCTRSQGWSLPGHMHEWQFPPTLPIALDRALLYTPAPGLNARDLIRHLRGVQTGQDVLLVLSPHPAMDAALLAYATDTANLCVCLDQSLQSEWLLHPAPQDVLLGVLSRQLRSTRISPYQTRGGITRPAAFFGRDQLLARVLNREPGNYLLVGGRQLGKTSLMKAIERRFVDHPHVVCRYVSLRDHRLDARLAAELELPADTPVDTLVRELAVRAGQRRLLLLIDETDLFLRAEAATGYTQLASLRALSEEGLCHFMLAGFWDLYEATSLDYASPIHNFGEIIALGALEHDAAIALATQPLQRLGIHYSDSALVERLVDACGHRANLIAILCQHGLEQLERGERVLDAGHVQRAMHSDALLDALAGWSRLSPDPLACLLDRIIVYRVAQSSLSTASNANQVTADNDPYALATALSDMATAGAAVDAESVRRAFARLQLAFVLKRERQGYVFAVPLFVAQFDAAEIDALLARELQTLRGAVQS